MGRGSQDSNSVPGSIEDTSPHHSSDGRRWYSNAPGPSSKGAEGANICCRKLSRKNYGRRNNSNRDIRPRPQGSK